MDPDTAFIRKNLMDTLRSGPTLVTFTKKDMTQRVMVCTLKMDLVPQEFHPAQKVLVEGEQPRKLNENQCRVYDLEVDGWRSFNYNSVIEFKPKVD